MPGHGLQSCHNDPLPQLDVTEDCPQILQRVKMVAGREATSTQAQIDTATSDSITLNLDSNIIDELQSSAQLQQEERNSTTSGKSAASIRGLSRGSRASDDFFSPENAARQEDTWDMAANQMPGHCEGDRVTYVLPPQLFKTGMYRNEAHESPISGGLGNSFSANSQSKLEIRYPLKGSSSTNESDGLSIDSASGPNMSNQNYTSQPPRDEPSDTECFWVSDCSETVPILEDRHPFLNVQSGRVRDALLRLDRWRLRWANRHLRHVPVQKNDRATRPHGDSSSCERKNGTKSGKKRATHGSERTMTKGGKDNPGLRKDASRWPRGHAGQRGLSSRTVLSPRWPAHMPRKMR
ncbi:hypothetical protein J3459_012439 [Metarhizium acridum]|uniref:uncharacterized protein n=1 Tax=Metarhizium acridum TaxID=92637 RepID=UPI001C6C8081|nr:hypothetical protein J3459_012439 [Metarhizium acridum]KAG8419657.1 hypothetical protein J3458_004508 [Metarhizium acridum]